MLVPGNKAKATMAKTPAQQSNDASAAPAKTPA
jgi:hypothetical protein